ncbi:MAG: ECF transporter S component [Ruminococcaceae bacterium]|nr:ECF transporter S component [Oscillospiraceae bacterium]
MKNKNTKKLITAAMLLALGMVLPLITGQLKEIGDSLLPMHLAVLLCGFLCGGKYGFLTGLILPLLRSVTFGMPPLYPNALYMSLELCTYGFVSGFLYEKISKKGIGYTYVSLVAAMVLGRVVWGISKVIMMGLKGQTFTISAFVMGGIVDAIPGIILQLILIPVIVKVFEK